MRISYNVGSKTCTSGTLVICFCSLFQLSPDIQGFLQSVIAKVGDTIDEKVYSYVLQHQCEVLPEYMVYPQL